MSRQKEAILKLVEEQKEQGRPVGEALATLGVARSTRTTGGRRQTVRKRSGRAEPIL
jgi:hypothetical protein